jgi:AbrB family looped-hinge helix DNA binding protein
MTVVKASARGQIVIPRDIRRRLNIVQGKKLLIKVEGEQVVIQPLPDDPVEAFRGIFAKGDSLTKALIKDRKGERRREDKKTA